MGTLPPPYMDSAFVAERVDRISSEIEQLLPDEQPERWFGTKLAPPLRAALAQGRCTVGTIVRLSLLQDCLRVVERIISADGIITDQEVHYARPLVRHAQAFLAKLRASYEEFGAHDAEGAQDFLRVHQDDRAIFGGACADTEWVGRDLVLRLAKAIGDRGPFEAFETLMVRLIDECLAISSDEASADAVRDELANMFRTLQREQNASETTSDPRIEAFCSPDAPEVFHAIAHASDIWRRDPFDVEGIHGPARDSFERLLDRAATHPDHGSILLILGDSGSGKTHLMRSFRARAHGSRLGYVGYLQMSSSTDNYARYVLHKLLDSLEKPYDAPDVDTTGLLGLSDAVLAAAQPEARARLASEELDDEEHIELVADLADELLVRYPDERFDIDVLRALLCLQRRDPRLNSRVMKYLRCEGLNARDQRMLGELSPKTDADDPARMLQQLGRVIYRLGGAALVLLVDQLEDIYSQESSNTRFQRAMDVMRTLADAVPSAVIVVACLDDFYTESRGALSRSVLDRIEQDPDPVHLTSSRNLDDIEALVGRRLEHLYDHQGARYRDEEPYFPFRSSDLQRLVNLRTRDVLEWFRRHHQSCIEVGRLVDTAASQTEPPSPVAAAPIINLEQQWSDFLAETTHEVPEDDHQLASLLVWALSALTQQTDLDIAARQDGRFVPLSVSAGGDPTALLLAICNKGARGGALGRQIAEVQKRAEQEGRGVGIVRCSAYPANPKTKIARQLGELIAGGGRRVVVEDADWRTMMALRNFAARGPEGFDAWLRQTQPLARIEAIRQLVPVTAKRQRKPVETAPKPPPKPPASRVPLPSQAPPPPPSSRMQIPDGALMVGTTRSLAPRPVTIDPGVLKRHAAFLGSTGSGKTTFMLHLLEECVLRGVPCLLVDRKGDLVTYGQPEFWSQPESTPDRATKKRALQERLDVQIYTPGEPNGRDLGIPIVPGELGDLPVHERSQLARHAADGLGAMMNYKQSQTDRARLGILSKAIEMMGEIGDGAPTLDELADLIASEDPGLVNKVGHIDTKHFKKLAESLSTLQLGARGRLLASGGEALDIDRMLGTDGSVPAGRSRLCVVSTKFLADLPSVDFWVSRLVLEIRRWASRRPSAGDLPQALILFDEADIYLPAQRKPAAKEPLMDLLKRGRSAGIGVLLATQSPGDLDYKGRDNINTWMLGRIAEKTALAKMKPLLSDSRVDVSNKLANASVGEFIMLTSGQVTELKAQRSIMETEQLPEEQIVNLAARSRVGG